MVAVAEGSGRSTTVAEHSCCSDPGGLLVSPDRRWALVPEYEGVRAIDLVSGSPRGAVRIDCLEGAGSRDRPARRAGGRAGAAHRLPRGDAAAEPPATTTRRPSACPPRRRGSTAAPRPASAERRAADHAARRGRPDAGHPRVFSRAEAAVPAPDGGAYVVVTPEQPGRRAAAGHRRRRRVHHRPVGADPRDRRRLGAAPAPGRHAGGHRPAAVRRRRRAAATGSTSSTPSRAPHGRRPFPTARARCPRSAGRRCHRTAGRCTCSSRSSRSRRPGSGSSPSTRLSGAVLDERDLADDVAAVSRTPAGSEVAGLVARPGGGVTLAFDATPDATSERPRSRRC